jgi:cellobiose phosphorylase
VLHSSFKLAAGESQTLVLALGLVKGQAEAVKIREKYSKPAAAENALQGVKDFWKKYVEESFTVATPDQDNERLINIWIKYQHRASMLQNLNTGRRGWVSGLPRTGMAGEGVRIFAR